MNIINESRKKDKLPLDFITQFISKGWDDTGNLKADIDVIQKEFSGTKDVCEILQKYLDSYLITISKLMKYIEDKKYLEIPEETTITEGYTLNEDLDTEVIVPTTVDTVLPSVTIKSDTSTAAKRPAPMVMPSTDKADKKEPEDRQRPEPAMSKQMTDFENRPLPSRKESLTESVDFFNMDFGDPEPDYEAEQAMQDWKLSHSN